MKYESEAHLGKDGTIDLVTTGKEKASYPNKTMARKEIGRERFWGRLESWIGWSGLTLSAVGIADLVARTAGPDYIASITKGPVELSHVLLTATSAVLCFYLTQDGMRNEDLAKTKEKTLKQLH